MKNGTPYGNFILGNNDKLMISYRRDLEHDYTMTGACGVMYKGDMHFFGGNKNFTRQHFVIEKHRSGQMAKMTKKEDLDTGFQFPVCTSLEITSEYSFIFQANFVVLCFDRSNENRSKSCYLFDDKLTYVGDSNYDHLDGGLTKYKNNFLTVGGGRLDYGYLPVNHQKTEIIKREENQKFRFFVQQDFNFTESNEISCHSLVTIESSSINEEYVLLIGGSDPWYNKALENVFKFNGTWFSFGKLQKRRWLHNSIYWNGAVYVIGGVYDTEESNLSKILSDHTKMEIWNIKDSPDQFQTTETWPELFNWIGPHLFIVPDSFFPDK